MKRLTLIGLVFILLSLFVACPSSPKESNSVEKPRTTSPEPGEEKNVHEMGKDDDEEGDGKNADENDPKSESDDDDS